VVEGLYLFQFGGKSKISRNKLELVVNIKRDCNLKGMIFSYKLIFLLQTNFLPVKFLCILLKRDDFFLPVKFLYILLKRDDF
jgi:hypothetical protein